MKLISQQGCERRPHVGQGGVEPKSEPSEGLCALRRLLKAQRCEVSVVSASFRDSAHFKVELAELEADDEVLRGGVKELSIGARRSVELRVLNRPLSLI